MTRLFVRQEPEQGMFLLDRDFKKRLIKVMRLKEGDLLRVFSPGKQWECRIAQIFPDGVHLQIVRQLPAPGPPGIHLTLAQAIPKGDALEWLIQKGTELGIAEIFPLITERTIVRPGNVTDKLQRWNEISLHAAGQSENPYPAIVNAPQTLLSFLKRPIDSSLRLILHEGKESLSLRELLKSYDGNRITYLVGPEGGWTDQEVADSLDAGYQLCRLGPRILRSDTSGLVLTALLQYERGDF